MNRINLLKPRASQVTEDTSALDVSSPAFLFRGREVVLGIVLLGIATGALYWQFGRTGGPEVFAGEESGEPDVVVVDMEAETETPAPPAAMEAEAFDPSAEPPLVGTAEVVTEPPAPAPTAPPPPSATPPSAAPPPATTATAAATDSTRPEPLAGDVTLGCDSPCAITAITAAAADDRVLIKVTSKGRPDAGSFRVDNPRRVVVDFPATNLELPDGGQVLNIDLAGALAKNVRVAQNSIDPPKVRLVVEVADFPDAEIIPSADGLDILLTRPK